MSAITVGTVEIILIRELDEEKPLPEIPEMPEMYIHKYEVLLGHFEDYTEIIRITDSIHRSERVEKLSGEWMRIHSILSGKGLLRGR